MVEVRTSRGVGEVVGDEPIRAGLSRMDVLLGSLRAAGPPSRVDISRTVAEVVGGPAVSGNVSRMDVLLGTLRSGGDPARVVTSRSSAEVVGGPLLEASISRLDTLVASLRRGSGPVRADVSRLVVEVVAPQGSAGPIVPLAESSISKLFLQNWVTSGKLRSSYLTAMSVAPDTGAESRRGLVLKPQRTMDIHWQVCGNSAAERLRMACLEDTLRTMGAERFQVPIYCDQIELDAAYLASDTTLVVDTTKARYFVGARVALVVPGLDGVAASHSTHIIETITTSEISLAAPLGVDIPAGALLFPLMDCEVALSLKTRMETARAAVVKITVSEVQGNNTLPPLKSDNPVNADTYDGYPIWTFEPDWSFPVEKLRIRDGSRNKVGRAAFTSVKGERSRQGHIATYTGKRTDMWPLVEFFDTRRGRLRSFWHIDQDQYIVPVQVTAAGTFINVEEIGDLATFSKEFAHVGIFTQDGRYFVRRVSNIQQVLTVFRITLDAGIPIDIGATDIVRIARARLCRFDKDEMAEEWKTTGYMKTKPRIIETVNERTSEL